MRLQTLAVVVCEGSAELRQLGFASEAAFATYLDELLTYAVISDAQTVVETNELYCFATCTDLGNSKRTILLATLQSDTETAATTPALAANSSNNADGVGASDGR
jgi:hypothetical protein